MVQGNDALVNDIVKAWISIMQGDFGLSLTQDGYLPAAFLVRCLTHCPILNLPLPGRRMKLPEIRGCLARCRLSMRHMRPAVSTQARQPPGHLGQRKTLALCFSCTHSQAFMLRAGIALAGSAVGTLLSQSGLKAVRR